MVEKCSLGHVVDSVTKECDEGHSVDKQVCLQDHEFDTTNRCTQCGHKKQVPPAPPVRNTENAPPTSSQEMAESFVKRMLRLPGMSQILRPNWRR